jgi:hypothetical protein
MAIKNDKVPPSSWASLMEAAGLLSLESISRLAQFVPRLTSDNRDAQLRGEL